MFDSLLQEMVKQCSLPPVSVGACSVVDYRLVARTARTCLLPQMRERRYTCLLADLLADIPGGIELNLITSLQKRS